MSLEDFCRDIVPTRVLTGSETIEICSFHGDKNYKPVLPELCGNTQPRTAMNSFIKSHLFTCNLNRYTYRRPLDTCLLEVSLNILTHQHRIELCSLVLPSHAVDNNLANSFTVKISQVSYHAERTPPVLVPAQAYVQFPDNAINIPASAILLPNREYKVTISSPSARFFVNHFKDSSDHPNTHLTVNYCQLAHKPSYYSCFQAIKYFTLTQ